MTLRLLLAGLLAWPVMAADPARVDVHGDPLPEGAVARFGTVRFRVGADPECSHLSADGSTLVTETDAGVSVWDVETGRLKSHFHTHGGPWGCSLAVSFDGKLVARALDLELEIYDATTGKGLRTLQPVVGTISFVPGTHHIAAAASRIDVFDATTGTRVSSLTPEASVGPLTPSGRYFMGTEADGTPYLVDAQSGEFRCRFPFEGRGVVMCRAVSADDRFLCEIDSKAGRFRVFAVGSGKFVEDLAPPWVEMKVGEAAGVSISPDASVAYLFVGDQPILRRDLRARKWLPPLPKVPGDRLIPHPDGKRLLVLDDVGLLRRYAIEPFKEFPLPDGLEGGDRPAVSPNGHRVVIRDRGRVGGRLRLFDGSGRTVWSRQAPAPWAVVWSPDGRRTAGINYENDRIVLLDPATGKVTAEMRGGPGDTFEEARFSPNGKQLLALRGDGALAAFDLATNKQIVVHRPYFNRGFTFTPDGRVLNTKFDTVSLFDPVAGQQVAEWTDKMAGATDHGVPEARASPDGLSVLYWNSQGTTFVLDQVTLAERRSVRLRGAETTYRTAISPNGLWLAAGTEEGRLSLWDIATGERLGRWDGHVAAVTGVSFVGGGRVVTSSHDQTALLWELRPKTGPVLPVWYALAGPWAADAYRAVWAVAADPTGPEFCRKYIPPANPVPAERLNRLLADLGADRYAAREAATKELQALSRVVEPELREARVRTKSEEVRTRLDKLLSKIPPERSPTELLHARAVTAMEIAGTGEAKKLLAEWAAGAPGAQLTTDAKSALIRLGDK